MPLTVLTDQNVRDLLDSLGREDIIDMHHSLVHALHSYSTATDADACCASNQPRRIQVKRKDGSTTLIMPASSDEAQGVKMVTVSESKGGEDAMAGLPLAEDDESSNSSQTPTSTQSSNLTRESSVSTTSSSKRPSQDPKIPGFIDPEQLVNLAPASGTSPKGSVTLLEPNGQPRALINAATLTAFRTALTSNLLLKARHNVHTLTVFGAGLQAYWHVHIALLLRGKEVHHLNMINRDFTRAQRMMMTLAQNDNDELSEVFANKKLQPSILTPEYGEYQRLLKEHVRNSDVIFCCTPSTTPLFPAGHLTHSEGRRKGRYIAAIGSYKPHMCELHPDVLQQAVASPDSHHRHHGLHIHHHHAHEGGAVVVDTIEGAMKEAGEVIQAGISGHGIVELGELVMLKKSHWAERAEKEKAEKEKAERESQHTDDSASTHSSSSKKKPKFGGHGLSHLFKHHHLHDSHKDDKEHHRELREKGLGKDIPDDGGLSTWLQRGNVIYKSVGIGLMDVVVGLEIVKLAEKRGFGTTIEDF